MSHRSRKVKTPKVRKTRAPSSLNKDLVVWTKVAVGGIMIFFLGASYGETVKPDDATSIRPQFIGTLIMSAAVVMLWKSVKFVIHDIRNSPSGVHPKWAYFVGGLALWCILRFSFAYAKGNSVNGWTQDATSAGIASGLAVVAIVVLAWSLRHKSPSPPVQEDNHEDVNPDHETGPLGVGHWQPVG